MYNSTIAKLTNAIFINVMTWLNIWNQFFMVDIVHPRVLHGHLTKKHEESHHMVGGARRNARPLNLKIAANIMHGDDGDLASKQLPNYSNLC